MSRVSSLRSYLVPISVLGLGLIVWAVIQRGGDRTAEAEPVPVVRPHSGPRLPAGSARAPSARPADDGTAVIRGLVEAVAGGTDLGPRLIALNELAALESRGVDAALAGIANDTALPLRVRRQALLLLAGKPGALARETMAAMLQSEEEDLRLAAAQGLGILGEADGFAALNEAFMVEPSAAVAKAIVQSMARIGTPEAVAALIYHSAPANLPSDLGRDAVLGALAGISNPQAVPALTAALADAPDAESRRAIVSSLARIADAASLGLLLELARNDSDHETRCQAMQGLGMIGNPLALETLRAIESATADTREQSYARTAIQRLKGL